MGRFVAFPSRQLLAQMEARMTHFVTLTVPSPRTDHSLRHSTTRAGLRARRVWILFFSRKRPFRAIFVSYSTRCSTPGPILCKRPGLSQNTSRWHFMRFWLIFVPYGPRSRPFTGRFVFFPSRHYLLKRKPEWHISALERSILLVPTIF
jgi:hypothetical protein